MNTVKSSLERLAMDQEKFLKVQRKVWLDTVLLPVTNPMSRRAISLDHKVLNKVEDINALLAPDGVAFVVEAGQIPLAQDLIDSLVPLIKDVANMVTLDTDIHLVALTSALWSCPIRRKRTAKWSLFPPWRSTLRRKSSLNTVKPWPRPKPTSCQVEGQVGEVVTLVVVTPEVAQVVVEEVEEVKQRKREAARVQVLAKG